MQLSSALTILLALAPLSICALPTTKTRSSPTISDLLESRDLSASAVQLLTDGACDLSGVQMPAAPTPLPPATPGLVLYHVALGRGTQNYSCTTGQATETPISLGAKAVLFNATCAAVRSPAVLSQTPALALAYPIPTSDRADLLLSGHHFFTNTTTAFFNLDTAQHTWGTVAAKKVFNSTAPANAPKGDNGMGSVAWLKLSGFEGDFKEVYRLDTAGGQPPKTCSGITGTFEVAYAAVYYVWK